MFIRSALLTILCVALLNSRAQAQQPPAQDRPTGPPPLALPDVGKMMKATNDLRKASESLVEVMRILEKITPVVAQASVATSHEMAMMSDGFDPFGFKASYRAIHDQNKIIQEQNDVIRQLQQAEIVRLKMELKQARKQRAQQKDKAQVIK